MQGKLLFLRAVPPQVEPGGPRPEPDWNLLFAVAGLDKAHFAPASPKWAPPDTFDSRADWEGQVADQPDLLLHVTAAAFHGMPVYFQVIAPWDRPWRANAANPSKTSEKVFTWIAALFLISYGVVGGFFARRNLRRGRGDGKGALRLAGFVFLGNIPWGLLSLHLVPRPEYISTQFITFGIPLFLALLTWIGYMAVEPYARRSWPRLMVSWQRLLSGRFCDPLVGRDLLFGGLAGSVVGVVLMSASARVGISEAVHVSHYFGQGLAPLIGWTLSMPARNCISVLGFLAILTIMTGMFRRRWLGLAVTGFLLIAIAARPTNATDFVLSVLLVLAFLAVLTRVSLVGAISFWLAGLTLAVAPPLSISQWYAGRTMIALLVPLAVLVWGFYVSLGGQPIFGSAVQEE